jgi:YfaZ precursor
MEYCRVSDLVVAYCWHARATSRGVLWKKDEQREVVLMSSLTKCRYFLLLLCAGGPAWAQVEVSGQTQPMEVQAIEGYLSEDAVDLSYHRTMVVNQIGSTDFSGTVFFDEERDLVLSLTGMTRIGAADQLRRFVIHGGARVYAAFLNTEDDDVLSAAIGGTARYYLGRLRGSSIVLGAFYGPDILTFGNADGVRDTYLRFEFGLNGRTAVFAGYRRLTFQLDEDRDIDDSVHIGARYRF